MVPQQYGYSIVLERETKKNWFVIVFLCFWMCGWAFGEYSALTNFDRSPFILIWLAGWTAGGLFAITTLLFMLTGKEQLVITAQTLTYHRSFILWSKTDEFPVANIQRLRVTEIEASQYAQNRISISLPVGKPNSGRLKFDIGNETYAIGSAFTEAECYNLIDNLVSRNWVSPNQVLGAQLTR